MCPLPCPAVACVAAPGPCYLMKQSLLVGLRSCSGGKIMPLLCNICSQCDIKTLKKVLFPAPSSLPFSHGSRARLCRVRGQIPLNCRENPMLL